EGSAAWAVLGGCSRRLLPFVGESHGAGSSGLAAPHPSPRGGAPTEGRCRHAQKRDRVFTGRAVRIAMIRYLLSAILPSPLSPSAVAGLQPEMPQRAVGSRDWGRRYFSSARASSGPSAAGRSQVVVRVSTR